MTETEIPDKFFGKFKLDRSENFDEFLKSKGVPWILRKFITFSSITKTFDKSPDDPKKYTSQDISPKTTLRYEWALGQTFEDKGFDGKPHKITFGLSDDKNTLTENHVRLENTEYSPETYYYTIENGELVLTMHNNDLTCRRYFKKIQ